MPLCNLWGKIYHSAQHSWVADPNANVSGTLRFTHVYVKRNGKWLLAALHNQLPTTASGTNTPSPSRRDVGRSEEAAVRKLLEVQFHQDHDLTCLAGVTETKDSNSGASVSLVKFAPGCTIPWHWHTPNENVMVVEGVLRQDWRDQKSSA